MEAQRTYVRSNAGGNESVDWLADPNSWKVSLLMDWRLWISIEPLMQQKHLIYGDTLLVPHYMWPYEVRVVVLIDDQASWVALNEVIDTRQYATLRLQ